MTGSEPSLGTTLPRWEHCLEGADDSADPVLLHGDLIPGNLLVADGRLTSVLEWGGLGIGHRPGPASAAPEAERQVVLEPYGLFSL